MMVDPSGYIGFWQEMAISIAVDLIVQGIINAFMPGAGVLIGDILSEALCTIIINAIDGEETSLGDIANNVLMGLVGGAAMKGALGIITIGLKKAGLGKVVSKVGKIFKKKVNKTGKGFNRFNKLKNYLGPAGKDKHWHHIVEQSQIKRSGFSPNQIHNTNNIIAVNKTIHGKITGHYNSKPSYLNGQTVRESLTGQSFKDQYDYGINVLKSFGVL